MGAACALVILAACTGDPEARRDEYLARAARYTESGRLADAVIAYRNALQIRADDAATHRKLGNVYLQDRQPRQALQSFLAAADLEPDNLQAQRDVAWMLLEAGDHRRALQRAAGVLARDPTNADALLLQAHADGRRKGPAAGIEAAQDLLALDPGNSRAQALIGWLQLRLGNVAASREALRDAVRLAPGSPDPHVALGISEWAAGRLADAETALRNAVDAAPAADTPNRALAMFLMATDRIPEAEPYARAAQRASAHRGGLLMAAWLRGMDRSTDARDLLRDLAAAEDPPADATVQLAALDAEQGAYDQALARVGAALRHSPRPQWLLLQGRVLMASGRPTQAAAALDRALRLVPEDPVVLFWRGLAARAEGDHHGAARWFDSAAARAPASAVLTEQRVEVALQAGDIRRASALARNGLQQTPGSVGLRILAARAERLAGDGERAARTLSPLLDRADLPSQGQLEFGYLFALRGQPARALDEFSAAAQDGRTRPEAVTAMVDLHARAGRIESALELLAGVERTHRDPGTRAAVAQAYLRIGQPARAEAIARAALEHAERSGPVAALLYTMLGLSLEALGRGAEARPAYEKAVALDAGQGIAANNLAWLELERGDLDAALRAALAARKALGDVPAVLHTLGWTYLQRGQHHRAIEALATSSRAEPGRARYRLDHATALLEAGRRNEGAAVLERLTSADLTDLERTRFAALQEKMRATP